MKYTIIYARSWNLLIAIERFPTLKVGEEAILNSYYKFCNELMINYKDIEQVRTLLHDKMYNGRLVIDIMADYGM